MTVADVPSPNKSECRVMSVVEQHQPVIMRSIAEYSKLGITNTTGIVEKLVKKKYLRRERFDADRRIIKIQLTPEGEKIYAMEQENYRKVSCVILDALDEPEQREMLRMLQKATRSLNCLNHGALSKDNSNFFS